MPKYIVERAIPKAGEMSPGQLKDISRKSNEVLRKLGPEVQWLHSYVADDKVYCVYIAKGPEAIREHAQICGIPADRISEVKTVIDPSTGG